MLYKPLILAVLVLATVAQVIPRFNTSNITDMSISAACEANQTSIGLSWCHYNNPFILSDFLSRNSSDLTAQSGADNVSAEFHLNVKCDGSEPSAICSGIQHIRSGSFGVLPMERGRSVMDDNVTNVVIFTDLDGQVLFVYFNNNTMAESMRIDMTNVTQFNTAQFLERNVAKNYTVKHLVLLLTNISTGSLVLLNGETKRVTKTCRIFSSGGVTKLTIEKTAFAPSDPADNESFLSLVYIFSTNYSQFIVENNNSIVPTELDNLVTQYEIFGIPVDQQSIRPYIETCPAGPPTRSETGILMYAVEKVKFDIIYNRVSNKTFVVAYTKKIVNMFQLEYGVGTPQNMTNNGTDMGVFWQQLVPLVPFWCTNATIFNSTTNSYANVTRYPSTVFCVPDNDDSEIQLVELFTTDSFSNIGPYTQDVFLAIGLKNSTSTSVNVVGMDELAFVNGSLLNPLALPDSFGTPAYPCNFDTEVFIGPFSNGTCTGKACCKHRIHTTFDLAGAQDGDAPNISNIAARAVNGFRFTIPGYVIPSFNFSNNGTNTTSNRTNIPPVPVISDDYISLFIATGRAVHVFTVYGTNQGPNSAPEIGFSKANEISFLGSVTDLYASSNAQHLFAAVTRSKWELDSQKRYLEICDDLASDPTDVFLKAFIPECSKFPAQRINLNTFTQYTSICTFSLYCPSLTEEIILFPKNGYFAERPAVSKQCPPGYFCISGQQQLCPPGFYCDEHGMTLPKRCPTPYNFSTTCAAYGQKAPLPCPDGVVCALAHIPGLPAPPGMQVPQTPAPRDDFETCAMGAWCIMGAQNGSAATNTSFACPALTFCPNASVIEPTPCRCDDAGFIPDASGNLVACNGRTLYCPAGTTNVTWCPAGSYCTMPNIIDSCIPTQYCPAGTFAPQLCPAGSYCADASAAVPCPEGFYCPQATVVPLKCNFLTFCPSGSASQSRSALAPVIVVGVFIGVLAVFFIFNKWQAREQAKLKAVVPKTSDKEKLLKAEDLQQSGGSSVPTSRFATPTIKFTNMGLTLAVGEAKGTKVLDDVTGVIPPGSFVAVMGPSGSGKSTFMHTLAGKAFYGERSGTVCVNGDEVDLNKFSKVVGFVKQDDIMLREMTVAETILFNAQMRYDPLSSDTPEGIANSLLRALDLGHVRDIRIGDEKRRGISGGQRKRVNIGMEMAALPALLFLDEPTSGLDSSSSMTVCGCLRDMASSGISVIAVIHQPRYEIFNMFHKVLLLAKGGKLVYYGAPDKALSYFEGTLHLKCPEHVNPPDFFMDVISGENTSGLTVDEMVTKWKNFSGGSADANRTESGAQTIHVATADISTEYGLQKNSQTGVELAAEASKKEIAGFFTQLWFFINRSVVQISRDLIWFFTDLLLTLVAGFFLGLVFSQSKYQPPLPTQIVNKSLSSFGNSAPSSLVEFFNRPIDDPIISEASLTCMAIGMTGVTAALRVFGGEQIVYWREASSGMSTVAYFTAKNITHLFFILFSPLLYLAPFLTFVSARGTFPAYYRVVVVVQFATTGLGYLVSIVSPPGLAQLAGVVGVLVFSMFGGSRPTLVEIKLMFPLLRLMPYMSYVRWGQEALYLAEIEEWSHIQGIDVKPSLELFDYHLSDYNFCMGMTILFGVLFRVLALIAMLVMHRDQKH